MTSASDVLTGIETGIETAESVVPFLTPFLAGTPLAAMIPFLQLLPVAVEAIQKIQGAMPGTSQNGAMTVLRSHMTAGMPNASALGPAQVSQSTSGSG